MIHSFRPVLWRFFKSTTTQKRNDEADMVNNIIIVMEIADVYSATLTRESANRYPLDLHVTHRTTIKQIGLKV